MVSKLSLELHEAVDQTWMTLMDKTLTDKELAERTRRIFEQTVSDLTGEFNVKVEQVSNPLQGDSIEYTITVPAYLLPEAAFEEECQILLIEMRPGHYRETLASLTREQYQVVKTIVQKSLRGRFVHRHKNKLRRLGHLPMRRKLIIAMTTKTKRLKENWAL